jgi:phosphatidyl-myo-inositol alpha-mannosyltransferase
MKKLNIGIYHATLPRAGEKKGGVEAAVDRLARSLTRRGNVDVVVFSGNEPPPDANYKYTKTLSRFNQSKMSRLFLSPLVMNAMRFEDIDLLHLHGDDWFYVWRGVPTVRTFHGSALHEARTAPRLMRKVAMRIVYPLERVSAFLATASIATNSETAGIYAADTIVGNSVDLDTFCPRSKTEYPSLFYVGTWQGRKRGAYLYREFINRVLPAIPDARLYMVIDACPEHPSVTQMMGVSDDELAAVLASSWVFAYPSIYEGFGIPYIEALASGTAVVATPNGGAGEVLEAGKYGVICDDDDFSTEIISLLKDSGRRQHYALMGRQRALHFDENEVAERIEGIYHRTWACYHK